MGTAGWGTWLWVIPPDNPRTESDLPVSLRVGLIQDFAMAIEVLHYTPATQPRGLEGETHSPVCAQGIVEFHN